MSIERDALAVVLDALTLPYAATIGGEAARNEVLADRTRHVVVFLQGFLRDEQDQAWRLEYLRERLAEHPPTGYVTHEQAHARMKAGASWAEAVRLDTEEEAPPVHQAIALYDGPVGPECGAVGRSVFRHEDVTCPDCRSRRARRISAADAIPDEDEPVIVRPATPGKTYAIPVPLPAVESLTRRD